ncbi:NUDIX hydrolase [Micromonospora sp. NPDC000316]|uniref:NUDIX hydrolase n=1 Tax=Micromonospora sp. NPDC000316 TaxID=3364216 RepID=UPI0036BBAC16
MTTLTWAVAAVVTDDTGRVLLCRQGERRYALPGGRLRPAESPVRAALRDIRAETGWEITLVDLVGVYHLSGPTANAPAGRAGPLPDILVHVFRARAAEIGPSADPPPGCRLSWHTPTALPDEVTPLTRAAVADAVAGRSGVLRETTWAVDPGDPAPRPAGGGADGRPAPGRPGWPGASRGVRAGVGHPPEQRGEAATDPSPHP